jgi:hypothetical protein
VLLPRQRSKVAGGAKDEEHAMSQQNAQVAVVGIDIVRTRSKLLVRTAAERLFWGKSGRAARLRPGLPICHPV